MEVRSLANLKTEGYKIEMDDTITAIVASKKGNQLLVNQSLSKPKIELLLFDSRKGVAHGTVIQKYMCHT